ncbi:VPS35 endosomal protein-sorting factor-like [Dermacentor andersoni]|uniref:VPS35 endosomal protein-sorting factor-like n=1 Tax=Dermacentor andersoni TaxID=34620 RepID=UPI002155E7AC|nr:VPS35 endosomal protein-sorting factor-like [Dermacentor andersoni]
MTITWESRVINYEAERKERRGILEEVSDHPLRSNVITEQRRLTPVERLRPSTTSWGGPDPLSISDGADPLSAMASEQPDLDVPSSSAAEEGRRQVVSPRFEPWENKKAAILAKYSTAEKLSIATSFLSGGEKVVVKTQSSVTDKVKNRLEQLDDFEEGSVREMLNLSQQEYTTRIEELHQALRQAWDQDQRVRALKIAIQCSKLLVDTSVVQFYPSKFVLITDILDNFGQLVYQRIHSKAEYLKPGSKVPVPLPADFTPDQVPESAKETCRNWFFKIASVRELIPRFYVETAILRCCSFLTRREYSGVLLRLTGTICGIGDPLVAAYARCYLCRVGMSVAPEVHEHVLENFWQFLLTYPQLERPVVQQLLRQQKLDLSTYLTLYCPALDWILQCVAHGASEDLLDQVLARCKAQCNSALLLNSIMTAFRPEFVANRALEFVSLMRDCDDASFPKHVLLRTLGLCLVLADPPEDQRVQVLNQAWKAIAKLRSPADYLSCVEVWIEFPCKHFTVREVDILLGALVRHLMPDRAYEQHPQQLARIVERLLQHVTDFGRLCAMEHFLPLLDLLPREGDARVRGCKAVMAAFLAQQREPTRDPLVLHALMHVGQALHASLNALALEDERRHIGQLLCGFLQRVGFGRDFEQQLAFYVDARAAFSALDPVLVQLVQDVNLLAMRTRQVVKGHHTRKTAAFVRACAAYCFITIPSLSSVQSRLELYLLSGQTAYLNQCLSQGDAFLQAAIELLPELPPFVEPEGGGTVAQRTSTEPFLVSYASSLLSTLLIVPDHPDHEPVRLLRGLLQVLHERPASTWTSSGGDGRARIFLNALNLLVALGQEHYLYHLDKVDSNDALYGGDPKFRAQLEQLCTSVLDQLLAHLRALGESGHVERQARLALELLQRIVIGANLERRPLFSLAVSLWSLAHRNAALDHRASVRCLEFVKKRASRAGNKGPYAELATKLQIPSPV